MMFNNKQLEALIYSLSFLIANSEDEDVEEDMIERGIDQKTCHELMKRFIKEQSYD